MTTQADNLTHTPGPWRFTSSFYAPYKGDHFPVVATLDGQRVHVADVANPIAYDEEGEAIDNAANAHLISAAPDLLAACEVALAAYQLAGKDTPENSTATALREAVTKAKGLA